MLKNTLNLFVFCLSTFVFYAQNTKITHPTCLNSGTNSYKYLGEDTLLITGSFTQFASNEKYVYKYNLSTQEFLLVNDSAEAPYQYTTAATDINISPTAIYFTNNQWQTYTTIPISNFPGMGSFVKYFKTNQGYLVVAKNTGQTAVYFSADGLTWNTTPSVTGVVGTLNKLFDYLYQIQGKTYYVQNTSTIHVSEDGGQSFQTINASGGSINSTKLIISDTNNFISTHTTGNYLSTNGGNSWSLLPNLGTLYYVNTIDSLFYRVVDSVFLSTDSGQTKTFYSLNTPVNPTAEVFNGNDSLFISNGYFTKDPANIPWEFLGSNFYEASAIDFYGNTGLFTSESGKFAVTYNGANTFDNRLSPIAGVPTEGKACLVINDSTFLMADNEGDIFKTTNKGATWIKKLNVTGTVHGPRKFYTYGNRDTIVLTHYDFRAKISTNGGETWTNANNFTGSIHYTQAPNGKIFAVNNDQFNDSTKIYSFNSSDNIGAFQTLATFAKDTTKSLSIGCFNENQGYLVKGHTANNKIYVYSTNDQWNTVVNRGNILGLTTNIAFNTFNIYAPAQDTVYLTRTYLPDENQNGRSLYYSYDGGLNWDSVEVNYTKYTQNPNEKIEAIYFFSSNQFVISTTFGRIFLNKVSLATNGGGNTTQIETIPLTLDMLVYPNPTSDLLTISSEEQITNLQVYDLTGKKMLENTFSNTISVSNLPSGTYLVRVFSGEKSNAKLFVKE